jgi:hypothetical protein
MPVWIVIFGEKRKVIKVISVDGALAGSEADGCWVLVWNCTR